MKKSDHTRTAACQLAVERLLAGLKEPARQRRTLELAIDHMQICPYCQSNLEYLVQALMTREEDRLTCRECQELLPEYLQAELEGRAHEERWRPIALHLEACSQCAAVYAALHDLAALAEGRRGTEPPHYPTPDLSFLEAGRATSPALPRIPWRLEAGRLIIEFTAELVYALQSPVRRAAYASAGLKSARSRRILYRFSLKEAVENLEVTVTAEEVPAVTYGESKGVDSSSAWIESVVLGSLENTSGDDAGYGDFTAQSVSLVKGTDITVVLTPGFPAASRYYVRRLSQQTWRIWVDWNHDGDFSDAGEEVVTVGPSQRAVSATFTVPADAVAGETRVRVAMKYYADGPPEPVEVSDFGEVEDYTGVVE